MPTLALPPPPLPPVALLAADKVAYDEREDLSDFRAGDVEAKLRIGLDGFEPAPWTLVTSLVGWQELQLCVDAGLLNLNDLTLGLGVEAYWARPWLLELLTFGSFFDWKAVDRGVAGRATLHVTSLSSVDPYLVVLAGPTFYSFEASLVDSAGTGATGSVGTGGLRTGVGGGLATVAPNQLMGGVELRYLASIRYGSVAELALVDEAGETVLIDLRRRHKGPNGFGWMGYVGIRF